MGTYCTIQGQIEYSSQEKLQEAIGILQAGGWMKDGKFIDNRGETVDKTNKLDYKDKALTIPFCLYRNLNSVLRDITRNTKCKVTCTCTDGCFKGSVIIDGEETLYDLVEWAKENLPEEMMPEPDLDTDFEDHCEWLNDTECYFHDEMIGDRTMI